MIINIAVVSYTAAALAFTLVTLLLLTSWRGRSQGALLTLACATSALWAAVIAYSGVAHLQSGIAADVLEILRSAAWFLLLVKLLEALKRYPMPKRRRITIEYTLVRGQNDSLEDAHSLSRLMRGRRGCLQRLSRLRHGGTDAAGREGGQRSS